MLRVPSISISKIVETARWFGSVLGTACYRFYWDDCFSRASALAYATLAGVPVRRTRTLLFALSGFFSGLTGILLLGYTDYVFVGSGDQYMLPSIIAVVIGGTSLAGGSGGYVGTMAGAVVLVLLQSILTTLNIPPFGRQIIFGVTLLGLMLLYGRQRRLRG